MRLCSSEGSTVVVKRSARFFSYGKFTLLTGLTLRPLNAALSVCRFVRLSVLIMHMKFRHCRKKVKKTDFPT